jgi:prepilin-type N-terminal cleavage/methylation domain-containing protein
MHNKRNLKNREKGLTIVEILVSIALFGIFSVIAVSFITSSLQSYNRGQVMHKLKNDGSFVLRAMQLDVSRATMLPQLGASSAWVPSAILVPNPYGVSNSSALGDSNTGTSTNRLIVSLNSAPITSPKLIGDVLDYQYIDYVVKPTEKNKLHRYTFFNLTTAVNGYTGYQTNASGQWLFIDSNLSSLMTPPKDEVLIYLPGKNDEIAFSVKRPAMTNVEQANAFGTKYQQYVVNISITLKSYIKDDIRQKIEYSEQTDANQLKK